MRWPAIDRAAAPALTRADELDGHACRVLTPTAEAPATLALRAVIDLALGEARPSRHRHAARLLAGCAELAPRVAGWRAVVPHDLHLAGLHAGHGRKAGLWAAVEDAAGR